MTGCRFIIFFCCSKYCQEAVHCRSRSRIPEAGVEGVEGARVERVEGAGLEGVLQGRAGFCL